MGWKSIHSVRICSIEWRVTRYTHSGWEISHTDNTHDQVTSIDTFCVVKCCLSVWYRKKCGYCMTPELTTLASHYTQEQPPFNDCNLRGFMYNCTWHASWRNTAKWRCIWINCQSSTSKNILRNIHSRLKCL